MKDVRIYLDDILESISQIESYIVGLDFVAFEQDEKAQDAVIRRLEIIGEATKRIPASFRDMYKDVPWKQISGMRDVLIHEYAGVSLQTVWKTIKEDIVVLREAVKKIQSSL